MLMQLCQLPDLLLKLSPLLHQQLFVLYQHMHFVLKYSDPLWQKLGELLEKGVGVAVNGPLSCTVELV